MCLALGAVRVAEEVGGGGELGDPIPSSLVLCFIEDKGGLLFGPVGVRESFIPFSRFTDWPEIQPIASFCLDGV